MRFAALRLGADTGVDVQHVMPRTQSEPRARLMYLIDSLVGAGTMDGTLRVPGAAGTVTLTADLRARQVAAFSDIIAPTDRGNRARITWLVRQLGDDAPAGMVIEAWSRNVRQPLTATLAQVRENPDVLLDPDKRELGRFRVLLRSEMGANRKDGGRAPGLVDQPLAAGELDHAIAAAQGKAIDDESQAEASLDAPNDAIADRDESAPIGLDDLVEAGAPLPLGQDPILAANTDD